MIADQMCVHCLPVAECWRCRTTAQSAPILLPPPEIERFRVGDSVRKVGGDYGLDGVVVAAFRKRSGQVRYVVEADFPAGLLLIYNGAQLQRRE